MVAVGTLRALYGAEEGDLSLVTAVGATVGSPTVQGSIASPAGRSGAFHYRCNAASTIEEISLPLAWGSGGAAIDNTGGITDEHFLIGAAIKPSDVTATTSELILQIEDENDAVIVAVSFNDDDIRLLNDLGGSLDLATAALSANTWVYVEVAFQHDNSSPWEWWIDGVSQGTGTSSFQADGANDPYRVTLRGRTTGEGTTDFDDIYVVSHSSTLQGNNLGPSEVFAYQVGINSGTADSGLTTNDDTIDISSNPPSSNLWSRSGRTPLDSTAWSGYGANPSDGARIFDEDSDVDGHDSGPVDNDGDGSHAGYDVTGTIQGAMWVGVYQRGTGGSSTHILWYGEGGTPLFNISMDTIANSTDTWRAVVSEHATPVPTSSESFAMGAGTTGAQDIEIREQWAFLLHTPAPPAVGGIRSMRQLVGHGQGSRAA